MRNVTRTFVISVRKYPGFYTGQVLIAFNVLDFHENLFYQSRTKPTDFHMKVLDNSMLSRDWYA